VEQNEALEKGDNVRAKEIGLEIKELQREKEKIKSGRMSDPPWRLIRGTLIPLSQVAQYVV
jgi:hypothetical protein